MSAPGVEPLTALAFRATIDVEAEEKSGFAP